MYMYVHMVVKYLARLPLSKGSFAWRGSRRPWLWLRSLPNCGFRPFAAAWLYLSVPFIAQSLGIRHLRQQYRWLFTVRRTAITSSRFYTVCNFYWVTTCRFPFLSLGSSCGWSLAGSPEQNIIQIFYSRVIHITSTYYSSIFVIKCSHKQVCNALQQMYRRESWKRSQI